MGWIERQLDELGANLLQNFSGKLRQLNDRILTAKKFNLTRNNKKDFQRNSLKALILLVGREGIEPSTY